MKYLLLDHMGVLDQSLKSNGEINESIVEILNKLVTDYGYKILFQSSNSLEGQLDLLKRLRAASLKKKLVFPFVEGLTVCDLLAYGQIKSDGPLITTQADGLKIAAYGLKKEGKTCMREALSVMFDIQETDRASSIVFDDNPAYVLQAQKEGYQGKYIDQKSLTFEKALKEVLYLEQSN